MEEDINFKEDESFYPNHFEDDLEYILGIEDLLHGSSKPIAWIGLLCTSSITI